MANDSTQAQWIVYDTRTGQQCGDYYADRRRARRKADQLDLAYGAVRYQVREVGDHGAWLPAVTETDLRKP